jgi:hypothetical protein
MGVMMLNCGNIGTVLEQVVFCIDLVCVLL